MKLCITLIQVGDQVLYAMFVRRRRKWSHVVVFCAFVVVIEDVWFRISLTLNYWISWEICSVFFVIDFLVGLSLWWRTIILDYFVLQFARKNGFPKTTVGIVGLPWIFWTPELEARLLLRIRVVPNYPLFTLLLSEWNAAALHEEYYYIMGIIAFVLP